MNTFFKRSSLLVALSTPLACESAESPEFADAPEPGGSESSGGSPENGLEVSREPEKVVLARIQRGDTYTIEFVEYPELGLAGVTEDFNLEHDGAQSLAAMGLGSHNSMAEIYEAVAQDTADPSVAASIRALDARLEVGNDFATTPKEHDAPTSDAPVFPRSTSGSLVAQNQPDLACNEGNKDWFADSEWFRDEYCDRNAATQYCDTLESRHVYTSSRTSNADVYAYNQSTCATAHYQLNNYRATSCRFLFGCFRNWENVEFLTIQPGWVHANHWYWGRDADGKYGRWQPLIESHDDGFTALALFAFTP